MAFCLGVTCHEPRQSAIPVPTPVKMPLQYISSQNTTPVPTPRQNAIPVPAAITGIVVIVVAVTVSVVVNNDTDCNAITAVIGDFVVVIVGAIDGSVVMINAITAYRCSSRHAAKLLSRKM